MVSSEGRNPFTKSPLRCFPPDGGNWFQKAVHGSTGDKGLKQPTALYSWKGRGNDNDMLHKTQGQNLQTGWSFQGPRKGDRNKLRGLSVQALVMDCIENFHSKGLRVTGPEAALH